MKNRKEMIADELMESMYDDGDWNCHICANQWIGIIHNWTGKEYDDEA